MSLIHRLSSVTVLDLVGADAGAILHNLTTNEVKSLAEGVGCETFITDVRGRTLAHVYAFRTAEGFRMVGAPGQASMIAAHADRYTIREDAVAVDRSDLFTAYVVSPAAAQAEFSSMDWEERGAQALDVDWLGPGTMLLLAESADVIERELAHLTVACGDDASFHHNRVVAGFPWYGVDLSDRNLPQEAARNESAISFVKGCYLGQETVARLDALGQVQKQLVCWRTEGTVPEPGSEVSAGEKVVGRLTSIAMESDDTALAIGMARRSHFDPGSVAQGQGFTATVIQSNS
ncbi:CAF17-like 4Fe-4S cluster assembly/insertion protein YgfZ [Roseiconus nitratireducens]|uniref:CAF17-like 4Fe-4S cluster assembly/insertion protein YgfZ n=1 Tax=Roseiconus nitratireducens TaxID=2605748 RepID=UPI001F20C0B6|nr:aminomethyltransferase [Roseiconus nitratireducens]